MHVVGLLGLLLLNRLSCSGINEAFLPWFVGFRFGEADHPGYDCWLSDGRKAWGSRADIVMSFHNANLSLRVCYMDSGASVLISACQHEVDQLKVSSLTWGGAAAAARSVDFEGYFRYFIQQDDGRIGFKYVWCLIVLEFGDLELSSVSQLNELGIGFDSPPGLVSREEADGNFPVIYRMRNGKKEVIASCPRGSNGLPVAPRLSTHTAAQAVASGVELRGEPDPRVHIWVLRAMSISILRHTTDRKNQ